MNTSKELDLIASKLQIWVDNQAIRYGKDDVRDDMLIMRPIITRGEIKEIIAVLSEASSQLENTVMPPESEFRPGRSFK